MQAGNKALPQNHPQNIELLDTLQKWLGEQGTPNGAPSATAQANAHGDIPAKLEQWNASVPKHNEDSQLRANGYLMR